jgi:hypothetical protein
MSFACLEKMDFNLTGDVMSASEGGRGALGSPIMYLRSEKKK